VKNHYQPVVDVLKKNNLNDLTEVILDTDHDCSCKRIALSETLLEWLSKQ